MKRFLIYIVLSPLITINAFSQRVEYKGIFSPLQSLVNPAEKPYREDICLNGSWQFQPVELPANFREGHDAAPELPPMQDGKWDTTPIRIPSPWNVNSFADMNGLGGDFRTYPSYPKSWENIKMGWLKREVDIPANWKDKRVLIHFEAVAGDAQLLVNGKPAGHHFGIFLPFDVDITPYVKPGQQNEIALGVRKASLFDKQGPYGRRTYQAGSFWGQHIAGIWQDVFLEALSKDYISDVYIQPKVSADKLTTEVTFKNTSDKAEVVTLDANVYKWIPNSGRGLDDIATPSTQLANESSLQMQAVKVKLAPHTEQKISLTADVKGSLKTWSPESPNLYGLIVRANVNGKEIDWKYTRFGWREVTFDGNKVLLNGKRVVFHGDSWHFLGIPQMTRRYAAAWFTAMHAANLNSVRLHAEPYPSFYIDVADEMGIFVLDESAIWASDGGPKLDDPDFWHDTKHHIQELVMRDRNHPAVFGWSVSNEVWPIVTSVFRDPPGMRDTLIRYYGIWRDIVKATDPSRPWISADGEDDGHGVFPDYVIHYGGPEAYDRGKATGKPWGVGEAGNAYYGTPEQVAETNGDRAYESFLGRMEGVAQDSYKILMQQREKDATYNSVFNLVWYGLKPLPLGLHDLTKAPKLNDGVYFSSYTEGQPGVQPERLGPYCTTLNPGYDPALPVYEPWPLFYAIKDASAAVIIDPDKWKPVKPQVFKADPMPIVKSIKTLGGVGSTLATELSQTGVPSKLSKEKVPDILFIDGAYPPATDIKALIDKVYAKGGTVMVWGVSDTTINALNKLLPASLEITNRKSSDLLPVNKDALISGISNADMYFSELRPSEIITHGLAGQLVDQSKVLLEANHTDWTRWNSQPEYAKTSAVVRSEHEAVPSGVALIKSRQGKGVLIVTTLPASSRQQKAEKLIRQLLTNAGIPLESGNNMGKPLWKDGTIARALYLGNFAAASFDEAVHKNFFDPAAGDKITPGATVEGRSWKLKENENGTLELNGAKRANGSKNNVSYLSFWVSSPRSLEDLLLYPNLPAVNLKINTTTAVQVFLNGKTVLNSSDTSKTSKQLSTEALKLRQGWNHFLIKLIQTRGKAEFSGHFTCNQPEFLDELSSALEKP